MGKGAGYEPKLHPSGCRDELRAKVGFPGRTGAAETNWVADIDTTSRALDESALNLRMSICPSSTRADRNAIASPRQ
jgi:hypothetical protein